MVEPSLQAVCPDCQTAVAVEPDWRLVQCPKCGAMITRMGEDSAYD
jgi:predicted RNA-binding Zn-ribbon protein involved in translation (DUF1610 family)